MFRNKDRVRINEAYAEEHGLWRQDDLKTLKGRTGSICRIALPVIEVLFDRRHPRGRDLMVTFHNPDCLERVLK